MTKKPINNISEAASQLMKERLAKHLDYVESLIKNWMQELSIPIPFVIGEKSWPVDLEFIPSNEKDVDKNHMIHRHLRSRALWRNHSEWERCIREIERLGIAIYKKAAQKHPGVSKNYLQTALWAAFETATGGKIRKLYELVEGKGVTFYGHIIDLQDNFTVKKREDEHWEIISELSKCEEITKLIIMRKQARVFQERMTGLANKALLSSDIFYPCKFCKRLMKA